MTEEWRMVLIAPKYEVSNYGRIRNKKTGYLMKRHPASAGGYPRVSLFTVAGEQPVGVARQVLLAFGPPIPKPSDVIGYWDRNINNCEIENLFWKSQFKLKQEVWATGAYKNIKPYVFTRKDILKAIAARK